MKIYTSGLESALLGHRGTDVKMVVALGGNAVLQRGDRPDAGVQVVHVSAAGQALASWVNEHEVLICRVNGPQVGMLASVSASGRTLTRSSQLDDLVTETVVDAADSAFGPPTGLVGPGHAKEQEMKLPGRAGRRGRRRPLVPGGRLTCTAADHRTKFHHRAARYRCGGDLPRSGRSRCHRKQ